MDTSPQGRTFRPIDISRVLIKCGNVGLKHVKCGSGKCRNILREYVSYAGEKCWNAVASRRSTLHGAYSN